MRFRAKDRAIREKIATLGANHIARITSDFKMDLDKLDNVFLISTLFTQCLLYLCYFSS